MEHEQSKAGSPLSTIAARRRESVAKRISPRAAFTGFGSRPGTVLSVLLICDDLFFGSH
jgi:hypothetical protein